MKRILIPLIFLLTGLTLHAQSRYLPLGISGSSLALSTRMEQGVIRDISFDAGYSLGGRMDFGITGGALFESVEGGEEIIPALAVRFDLVILKQQSAVPFSLQAGMDFGFASALPENRTIFGTIYGFNMLITHDFRVGRFIFGLNGVMKYNRIRYDIEYTAPPSTSTARVHQFFYGVGADVGFMYIGPNILSLRADALWDQDMDFSLVVNLGLVVPSRR